MDICPQKPMYFCLRLNFGNICIILTETMCNFAITLIVKKCNVLIYKILMFYFNLPNLDDEENCGKSLWTQKIWKWRHFEHVMLVHLHQAHLRMGAGKIHSKSPLMGCDGTKLYVYISVGTMSERLVQRPRSSRVLTFIHCKGSSSHKPSPPWL